MECVECGINTSFEWPGSDDPKVKALWETVYEGPLCKLCSGDSPMSQLTDQQDPLQKFCFLLRRRGQLDRDGFDSQLLLNHQADGPQNLDDIGDL